ncbi:ATP-binding protein [Spirosoma soli]|uniref:histidine kinase n=1 Tax=Spirosoma soli TaxID=1770529 RepID=A0ABW5MCY1_9BACT
MRSPDFPSEFPFLAGGGELGELIRQYDWQTTSLGRPQQWPQSLRSMVSLVLMSKFPMMLFWGRDFIQLYNDAYRPSLGQEGKHPQALGQSGPESWPEIWSTFAQPLFDQITQTRESVLSEDQLIPIYRNGQFENAYWTYTYLPVIDETGQVGGILAIVHETTQKVNNVLALQQSTADLERSNANLELFATAASHDLQEPLRKIKEFGALLRTNYDASLDHQGIELINRMEAAAGRMSVLIRDLLTYSRLATDGESVGEKPLNQIVDDVLTELDQYIAEKKAVIDIGQLGTVRGDATQLEQLFRNLLSNALKFVKADVVPHIGIKSKLITRSELPPAYQPSAQHEHFRVIEVTDNGIGFEQGQAERIFDTFYRLHNRQTYPGTGIGLAIVKRVVENHHGYSTAWSQPGQGATFCIYLPV